jgi:hypothetical protein
MPYGTVNADVIQTSTTGGVLGAGNASIMKNRLINGSMTIDQRAAGASVTTPTAGAFTYATCDRWAYFNAQASKYTLQQNSGAVTPPAGFVNYLGAVSTSAYSVLTGDYFTLSQAIEGFNMADLNWGTADAKTVTLSFWVRSSLTGTFGGSITNSANNRSYPFTYTITSANTWEYETITIAGDTSGTWLTTNGKGMIVIFGLGVGSTYSGTAGSWTANQYFSATGATSVVGTNGATFYITGVQLEVGSSATGFEYRQYGTELQLCQRYYCKNSSINVVAVNNTSYATAGMFSLGVVGGYSSGSGYAQNISFPTSMRTEPTIVYINTNLPNPGTSGYWSVYSGSWVNAIPTTQSSTTQNFGPVVGSYSGTGYMFYGGWTASAEL